MKILTPSLQYKLGTKNNVYPTVFLACPQGVTLTPLQAALWTSRDVTNALDSTRMLPEDEKMHQPAACYQDST